MNFYKHHIGDYAQATAHLSFVEDAAYSRILRKYYADERPMPADLKAVQRLVGARTREEKEAVHTVLEEFFELREDGWHNKRCDAELEKANAQAETNRRIAEEREARRRERMQHASSHESLHGHVHESLPLSDGAGGPGFAAGQKKSDATDGGSPEKFPSGLTGSDHVSPRQHSNPEHESSADREPSQTPDARHQDARHQTPDLRERESSADREEPSARPSMATAVCLALKAVGVGSVSPGHPRLIALVAAGAEVQHFVDAARQHPGKGFAYLLATVEGQMADARQLAAAGRTTTTARAPSSGSAARAARMAEARGTTTNPEARDATS